MLFRYFIPLLLLFLHGNLLAQSSLIGEYATILGIIQGYNEKIYTLYEDDKQKSHIDIYSLHNNLHTTISLESDITAYCFAFGIDGLLYIAGKKTDNTAWIAAYTPLGTLVRDNKDDATPHATFHHIVVATNGQLLLAGIKDNKAWITILNRHFKTTQSIEKNTAVIPMLTQYGHYLIKQKLDSQATLYNIFDDTEIMFDKDIIISALYSIDTTHLIVGGKEWQKGGYVFFLRTIDIDGKEAKMIEEKSFSREPYYNQHYITQIIPRNEHDFLLRFSDASMIRFQPNQQNSKQQITPVVDWGQVNAATPTLDDMDIALVWNEGKFQWKKALYHANLPDIGIATKGAPNINTAVGYGNDDNSFLTNNETVTILFEVANNSAKPIKKCEIKFVQQPTINNVIVQEKAIATIPQGEKRNIPLVITAKNNWNTAQSVTLTFNIFIDGTHSLTKKVTITDKPTVFASIEIPRQDAQANEKGQYQTNKASISILGRVNIPSDKNQSQPQNVILTNESVGVVKQEKDFKNQLPTLSGEYYNYVFEKEQSFNLIKGKNIIKFSFEVGGKPHTQIDTVLYYPPEDCRLVAIIVAPTYTNDLKYNKDDARRFEAMMRLQDDSTLYGSKPTIHTLIDRNKTTHAALNNNIQTIIDRENLDSNDKLVIFYSGHGDMKLNPATNKEEFCLRPTNTENYPQEYGTMLKYYAELITKLNTCPALQIVILDACMSGAAEEQASKIDASNLKRRIVFRAAGIGTVLEDVALKGGVFSCGLMNAMLQNSDGDINKDGYLTADEINNSTIKYVKNHPKSYQIPSVHVSKLSLTQKRLFKVVAKDKLDATLFEFLK